MKVDTVLWRLGVILEGTVLGKLVIELILADWLKFLTLSIYHLTIRLQVGKVERSRV